MFDGDNIGVMVSKDRLFAEVEASKHHLEKHPDLFGFETELMEVLLQLELMEVVSFQIEGLSENVKR